MRPEFQAKFLMHLNGNKKGDEGFTLIELLVVIIIIGILAAIALPSLLGQANKAKQSEARQNVGSVNRAQQAFALGRTEFTSNLAELGIGIKSQTDNYIYVLKASTNRDGAANYGAAYKPALKSYVGLNVTAQGDTDTGEVLTLTGTCETIKPAKVTGPTDAALAVPTKLGPDGAKCEEAPKSGAFNGGWKDLSGG
ncbi:type IV pilin-like G/H family protein [Spirulina subsalsa]|uniref:type IV pilin-like G/H family protein n=1 Tax=Spirulina subsalsa TaxID=54311 RepID=UPI00030BBE5E|nr:type IV pilin-like G/H family protein [Spirulina subsalsa]